MNEIGKFKKEHQRTRGASGSGFNFVLTSLREHSGFLGPKRDKKSKYEAARPSFESSNSKRR